MRNCRNIQVACIFFFKQVIQRTHISPAPFFLLNKQFTYKRGNLYVNYLEHINDKIFCIDEITRQLIIIIIIIIVSRLQQCLTIVEMNNNDNNHEYY